MLDPTDPTSWWAALSSAEPRCRIRRWEAGEPLQVRLAGLIRPTRKRRSDVRFVRSVIVVFPLVPNCQHSDRLAVLDLE